MHINQFTFCWKISFLVLPIKYYPFLRIYDMHDFFAKLIVVQKRNRLKKPLPLFQWQVSYKKRRLTWTFEKVRVMSCFFFCFITQKTNTKLIWAYEKHKNYSNLVGIKSLKGQFQVHNNKTRNLWPHTKNEHFGEPFNILISN